WRAPVRTNAWITIRKAARDGPSVNATAGAARSRAQLFCDEWRCDGPTGACERKPARVMARIDTGTSGWFMRTGHDDRSNKLPTGQSDRSSYSAQATQFPDGV